MSRSRSTTAPTDERRPLDPYPAIGWGLAVLVAGTPLVYAPEHIDASDMPRWAILQVATPLGLALAVAMGGSLAGLADEVACRVATSAGLADEVACRVATSAGLADEVACRVATSAGLADEVACRVATSAGLADEVACRGTTLALPRAASIAGIVLLGGAGVAAVIGGLGAATRIALPQYGSVIALAWLTALAVARDPERLPRRLALAALVGATSNALIAMAQALAICPPIFEQAASPAATFIHRNSLAHYLVGIAPLGLAIVAVGETRRLRALALAASVTVFSAIALTLSRGAWLGALVGTGGAVALALGDLSLVALALPTRLAGRRRPLILVGGLAAAAALVLVALAVALPEDTRLARELKGKLAQLAEPPEHWSGSVRLYTFRDTLSLIAAQPLGVGPGRWPAAFPSFAAPDTRSQWVRSGEELREVHNDVLQLAAEAGLPAALGFLGLVGAAAIAGFRVIRNRGAARATRLLHLGALGGVAGILVNALVSFPLQRPASALVFWILVGMLLGNTATFATPTPARPFRSRVRLAIAALLVAVAGLLAWQSTRLLEADRALWRGGELWARGEQREALATLSRAAERTRYPRLDRALVEAGSSALDGGAVDPRALLTWTGRLLEDEPASTFALINRGRAAAVANDVALGRACYLAARALAPELAATYEGLGAIALHEGNPREAEVQFRTGLRCEEDLSRAPELRLRLRAQVAASLVDQERRDEATALVKVLATSAAIDVTSATWLARRVLQAKMPTTALLLADAILAKAPRAASALLCRGAALGQLDRHEPAVEALRRAIAIEPALVDAHVNLGAAYARLGRWDEADAALRRALTLEPTNVLAERYLRQVEARSGGNRTR